MKTINASANENKDESNTNEYNLLENELYKKTSSTSFDHSEEESRFSNMKSRRKRLSSKDSNGQSSTSLGIILPEGAQRLVEQNRELNQITISDALKLVCIIYSIACCVAGIIIPTAEALKGKWNEFVFGAVLLNFQLTVAIAFLVCLFALIYADPGKGRAHRTETAFATSMGSNMSPAENNVNVLRNGTQQGNGKRGSSSVSSFYCPTSNNSTAMTIWVDISDCGDVFTHSETLLIVRIGSLVLSLGNLIYYGFESAQYVDAKSDCDNRNVFNWSFFLRLLFVLLQTYFMFKRPEITHMKKYRSLIWFGMFHLVSTNACLWLRTVINEILLEINHAEDYTHVNEANSAPSNSPLNAAASKGNETQNSCDNELLEKITPYLFPFVMEYSLMAVGTIGSLLHSLAAASSSQEKTYRDIRNAIRVLSCTTPRPTTTTDGSPASGAAAAAASEHGFEENILDKSHTGFFVGALVVGGIVASTIVFFKMSLDDKHQHFQAVTYLITNTCLHGLMLVGCIAAFVLMRPLAYLPKIMSIDDALIMVGMCGSLMLQMAIIVPGSEAIGTSNGILEVARLAASVMVLVQTVVQSLLLVCVMRMYASRQRHAERMPGRGIVTSLVIMNLVAWVYGSISIKSVKIDIEGNFYGVVPWLLICNINLPLELFFRFHCGICFADVWHLAYQSPKMIPMHSTSNSSCHESGIQPTDDERSVTGECVLVNHEPVYTINMIRTNSDPNVRGHPCDGRLEHLGSSARASNLGPAADGNHFNDYEQRF